jgi:hypothetical protein
MIRRNPSRVTVSICLALVIAIAGAWYLLARADGGSDSASLAVGIPGTQRPVYRFLRDPNEDAPHHVMASIRQAQAKSSAALRVETSHLVHSTDGGIWVVTGRLSGKGVACAVQASRAAVSCAPIANIDRNGLALGIVKHPSKPPHVFLVLGIAPDWARSVRAQVGVGKNATARTVPVRNNAYAIRAGVPIFVEGLCRGGGACERLVPFAPTGG